MNTLIDTPKKAVHKNGVIIVKMGSGIELRFDIKNHMRLRSASHAELNDIEISPFGLHWPKLDEDLSIRGLQATNKKY